MTKRISQLQDTALCLKVLQLNLQTLPQTYCRLKESKCVAAAHSQVVKSSYVGPLRCPVFGMSGKLLDLAKKDKDVIAKKSCNGEEVQNLANFFFLPSQYPHGIDQQKFVC